MLTSFNRGLLGTSLALGLAFAADAAVIDGNQFTNGLSSQSIGGISWQAAPAGRTFQQKTLGTPAFAGVGLSGGVTGDEIDIGEFLTGTSASSLSITSFTLGVLFDGPEFGDVQEIARVTITPFLGAAVAYTLTSGIGSAGATWSGPGTVTNLSPPTATGGAVWQVSNPFGAIADIRSIEFTALSGICGSGACNNQSDFTLVQLVTAVPEPASLALLGAGLLGLGAVRRRRA